jgi:O-antigen/teichoic acid export membrane protein
MLNSEPTSTVIVDAEASRSKMTNPSPSSKSKTTWYYIFIGIAGVTGLLKGVVYAKLMGSEGLGYFALAILFSIYVEYFCHLGLYRGLECFLPFLYGAGKEAEAESLRNLVFSYILLFSSVLLILVGVGCYFYPTDNTAVKLSVFMAVGMTMTNVCFGLGLQDLRSRTNTFLAGALIGVKSIFIFPLGTVLLLNYGFQGALIAEIAVPALLFLIVAKFFWRNFGLTLKGFNRLRPVFASGFPLILKNLANDLSLNLDRWCIVAVFGLVVFGQYAFAMLLVSAGLIMHNAIWSHVGPQAAFSFGKDENINAFLRSLNRLSLIIIIIFVVSWIPFEYTVGYLVPRYFSTYTEGAKLFPVIYLGVMFQVLCQYEWVPMALKRTPLLFVITLICTISIGLLYAAGVWLHWSMLAFAWIFTIGRALNAAGQFLVAYYCSYQSTRSRGYIKTTLAAEGN